MSRFEGVGAGKGCAPRDVDKKKYDENYDRVFGKKPLNIMKEKEDEEAEGTETPSRVGDISCDENQTK